MEKRIINHSKLEEITDGTVQRSWGRDPEYMFLYHGRQVAKVSLVEVSLIVRVHHTYAPWAYVTNDKGQFFTLMSVVEDQCHGTNIIDTSNLQALYMEHVVNKKKVRDSAQEFADLLNHEMEQSIQQMKNYSAYQTLKDGYQSTLTKITTPLANQHKTFPMWNSKGQKK